MKVPLKVISAQEVLADQAWGDFLAYESQKFLDKTPDGDAIVEAVIILSSPAILQLKAPLLQDNQATSLRDVDLIIVDPIRVSKIQFSQKDDRILWSDSEDPAHQVLPSYPLSSLMDSRIKEIFEMLNGKVDRSKIKQKPLFAW
jgi:hypothetical protein